MSCYRGGLAVEENFQMCDVTSEHELTHQMPLSRRYFQLKMTNIGWCRPKDY